MKNIFEQISSRMNFEINPYVKEMIDSCRERTLPIVYGPHLLGLKGHWKEYFIKNNGMQPTKLILEIGVHNGRTMSEMAKNHSDFGFIGMDITFKRVVTSAKAAKESSCSNILSILGDARFIDEIFQDEELDAVIAFFPDPWIKKPGQTSKRLFKKDFLQMLSNKLKPNGSFWFKTDAQSYFQEVEQSLQDTSLLASEKLEFIADTYRSTFERKFLRKNLPIFEGVWSKG